MRMSKRAVAMIAFTGVCIVAAFLLPRMAQPLSYHDFADHRVTFGIPNFGDVVSNVAFLIAGVAGLVVVFGRPAAFELPQERWPYAVFFFGLVLTALGSSYYHLAPDNARLFWDRLPMTIAFMGLVASQIVDRISVRAGLVLLLPMLIVGAVSVICWRATERAGVGNVIPYALLQGYTIVVLVLIALLWRSRYTRGRYLLYVFVAYVLGKLCEYYDAAILGFGGVVSGHTLKHLFAAGSGSVVCAMLAGRTLQPSRAAA
jgi:hypothetical protein